MLVSIGETVVDLQVLQALLMQPAPCHPPFGVLLLEGHWWQPPSCLPLLHLDPLEIDFSLQHA